MKPVKEITQAQRKIAARGLKPAAPSEPGLEGKNIEKWTAKALLQMLNTTYQQTKQGQKAAMLVLGAAGIGKSEIVQGFARSIAKSEGREFVHIDDLKNQAREAIMEDPSKYYIFLDLRAGQLNPEMTSGVPRVDPEQMKKGYLKFMPPDWAYLISNDAFSGMVFLDELNRGQEHVLNSLYQFVLDRIVSGRRIGSGCTIVGAANLGTGGEFSGTHTMDSALMSRFSVGVLVADADEWIEWAQESGVDPNILAFIKSNPGLNFYAKGEEIADHNIPINPRNITAADRNLKFIEKAYEDAFKRAEAQGTQVTSAEDLIPFLPLLPGSKEEGKPRRAMTGHIYNDMRVAIGSRLGNRWATAFIEFLETIDAFEWADILEKTKGKVWMQKGGAKGKEELDSSKLWALTNYIHDNIASRYNKAVDKKPQNEKEMQTVAQELATIFGGIPKDNVIYLLKSLQAAVGHPRPDKPQGLDAQGAAANFAKLLTLVANSLKTSEPELHRVIGHYYKNLQSHGVTGGVTEKLSAKRMYENLTLSNRKATPEQIKALEGSNWHHVYHGTVPEAAAVDTNFKSFFSEENENLTVHRSLPQLAEFVADRIEERFGLHYSNLKTEAAKGGTKDNVTNFAVDLLKKVAAANGDKEKIIKAIQKADIPQDALVRLHVMSGAKY